MKVQAIFSLLPLLSISFTLTLAAPYPYPSPPPQLGSPPDAAGVSLQLTEQAFKLDSKAPRTMPASTIFKPRAYGSGGHSKAVGEVRKIVSRSQHGATAGLLRVKRRDSEPAPAVEEGADPEPSDSDSETGDDSDSGSDSESEGDGEGEGAGETVTLSVATQTLEVEGDALPTGGALEDPTGGGAELKLAMMWETTSEFDTDIGKMTEKCLIPFDNPSQKFCETTLNGQPLGAVGDQVAGTTSAAATTTTALEQSAAPTTVAEGETTSAAVETVSSEVPPTTLSATPATTAASSSAETAASALTSPPIDFTVGDAVPTTSEAAASASSDVAVPNETSAAASIESAVTSAQSTAAAAAASEEAAEVIADNTDGLFGGAFVQTLEIPGQKLQVLPIGLGVFGGLVAIVLLVVAYVTYQRRKFKKQFRNRKLAEKAAPMGMGSSYGSA